MVHLNLQELLKKDEGWECEQEVILQSPGSVSIIGHVDAVYRKDGLVVAVEIKTVHSDKQTPLAYNVRQLKYYLAMLNADYGILLYVKVGPNIKEHFVEHLVTWDYRNECRDILAKLEADAVELQRGIDEKNPAIISHIFNFHH
jgi:hypothetical protein